MDFVLCSFLTSILAVGPSAYALPAGGVVASGNGAISQSGTVTTINQASSHLSLTWNSFNIGAAETVNFVQPSASSIAVNRIHDVNGTQILGKLNANGQVFLINPNGILFGAGSQVNVGGLVASALDLGADGKTFSGAGGSVVNKGTLTAADGGYIALLGSTVSNQGVITARLGTVALGAGNQVTLDFSGDQLVSLTVDSNTVAALAENKQLIRADGGVVIMSAGARDSLVASVVNNTGIVQAQTIENRNGRILLLGGMKAGTTTVAGILDASASVTGDGGFIETSAAHVIVADTAKITTLAASGKTGTWLIDPTDFTIAASGGDITGTDLSTQLASSNITIQSTDGVTTGNGDIFVNDAVSWSANTTLTLVAERDIVFHAPLTATGDAAGLVLSYGAGAGYSLNGSAITLSGATPTLQIGETGSLVTYTVINSLGAAGSTTGTDLQGINGDLTGHYALGSNIDATATATWNAGAGFAPLGDGNSNFTGAFSGLGHTIAGLTINQPGTDNIGLFGSIGNGGSVSDVGLVDAAISGHDGVGGLVGSNSGPITNAYVTGAVTGRYYVGGLVGGNSGRITNAYATGTVTGTQDVGGLVGQNDGPIMNAYATGAVAGGGLYSGGLVGGNSGTIANAYATGAVTGSNDVGGLVGANSNTIANAYATGAVTGSGTDVGGLVGLNASTILSAYATGAVSGGTNVGGLVGENFNNGTITAGYWDQDTTGQSMGVGLGDSTGAAGLTTSGAFTQASYGDFDFDHSWFMVDGETRPFLRSEYSTTITNAHQLQLMVMDLTASYTLANNIDVSATAGTYAAGMWTTAGFATVGGGGLNFTGVFSGLGHTITGLTINRPGTYNIGLFGSIGTGGAVSDVGLVDAAISGGNYVGGLVGYNYYGTIANAYATGTVSGAQNVGGLVGESYYGTITNAYATGTVSGTDYSGGLVGYNYYGTIKNAYATGSVSGADAVGGLVGENNAGTITNAYATGSVVGTSNFVGGLVGFNYDGTITNAYATGSVSGADDVGGLVGENYSGEIRNTYATGLVVGSSAVGGLIGYNGGTITAGYWDTETTGQSEAVGNTPEASGATGLTTSGAFTQASYGTDFDFINTWFMVDGETRPFLRSEYSTTITNAHQLQLMAMDLTASYTLANNIDVSATDGSTYAAGMWTTAGFVPVGNESSSFTGAFAGLGHTITGLTINRPITGYIGLFGFIGNGVAVSDVGLVDATILGSYRVGGLAGFNYGTITNAYATGSVSGGDDVGGLVGISFGTITNAYATGAVTGNNYVGGLVGLSNGSITNAYATGAVTGSSSSYVGGLVGDNESTITNVYATGAVTGSSSYVGGLVGDNNGTITAGYWDTDTTAQITGVGVGDATGTTGLTTAEFQDTAGFMTMAGGAGWDFDTTWAPPSSGYYPQLYALTPVVYVPSIEATRVYGDDNSFLTATNHGGPASYVFGPAHDTLVIGSALGTSATSASGVGSYAITVGASVNSTGDVTYRIVSFGGTLSVTPRPIFVFAKNETGIKGKDLPELIYMVSNLIDGDSLNGALATTATSASAAGNYAITQGDLTAGSNYEIIFFVPGVLTIKDDSVNSGLSNAIAAAQFPSQINSFTVLTPNDDGSQDNDPLHLHIEMLPVPLTLNHL